MNMLSHLLLKKTKIEPILRELCFRRDSSQHSSRILITEAELKMLASKPLLDSLVHLSNFKTTVFGAGTLTKMADYTIHVRILKISLKVQDLSTKNKPKLQSLKDFAKWEKSTKEEVNSVQQTATMPRNTHTQRQNQGLFNLETCHGI